MLTHLPADVTQTVTQKQVPETLAFRLWTVYSLSFLNTVSAADPALAKGVAGSVAFAFIAALAVLFHRRQWNGRWTELLLASTCHPQKLLPSRN